jgi:hypothetical protein
MDDDPHRQPFAVDQGVDFAALDLLAGVVTDLLVITAPFFADLTDWLSRTAAEGLASRPSRSRKAMCSSAADRPPDTITLELKKDVVDSRAWRKAVTRQVTLWAAGAQQMEYGVHRRQHVGLAWSAAWRSRRDQRFQPRPLCIL